MKVAAILGEHQAGLVEVPDPTPKEDWVVVKIHASPMCTEYHAFEHGSKTDRMGAVDQIRDLTTDGRGVDFALDCSGNVQAHRLCIDSTRRRGTIAFVGQSGRNDTVIHVSPDLIGKGLRLAGAWHYNLNQFPELMKVIEGSTLLDLLISNIYPMSQIQQAFETSVSHESSKIILKPWE